MNEPEIEALKDPIALFQAWFTEAKNKEPSEPEAMALATARADGMPNVRMVLLKQADDRGFVFYSNSESVKGEELKANAKAALCFHWKSLGRQVRVRGLVAPVSAAEADAYFATRPKDSQIGAWASPQSRPMKGRFELEKAVAAAAARYTLNTVPRPPYWNGYRVQPLHIEFWRNRPFRLHDRLAYNRADLQSPWQAEKLYP